MFRASRLSAALLLTVFAVSLSFGQPAVQLAAPADEGDKSGDPIITAVAGKDQVRFVAMALVQRMRLEIVSSAGDFIYDSDFRAGNRIEWAVQDQQGMLLNDGVYGSLVTTQGFDGRTICRRAIFQIRNGRPSFVSEAMQATLPAGEEESLTVLKSDDPAPLTLVSHDGEQGWIESTRGALSFDAGNPARALGSVPHMRLTQEGNLGIGVVAPQARLDVDGLIRTSAGIVFPDGTIQRTAAAGLLAVGGAAGGSGSEGVFVVDGRSGKGAAPAGNKSQERFMLAVDGSIRVNANEAGTNTWFGENAGIAITSGGNNSFFGNSAGYATNTGNNNSFVGLDAGYSNTGGNLNTNVGAFSGWKNTTGSYNSFFGSYSGEANTNGQYNSFIGAGAGGANTSGSYNTCVGSSSCDEITTQNGNSFLGAFSSGIAGLTNASAIGYQAQVSQSNSLVLGSINGVNGATSNVKVGIGTAAPVGAFHVKSGVSELFYVGTDSNIGFGTVAPDKRVQIVSTAAVNATLHLGGAGDETKDIFAGMGSNVDTGPAFNYGYSGFTFGRSSGFFNIRPDAAAVAPNPSLRFMTVNQQRMIITNEGKVGIGTSNPRTTLQTDGGDIYVGSPGQGVILKSPDGMTCGKLTVNNAGALTFTTVVCP